MFRSPSFAHAIRALVLVAVLTISAVPASALPPAHFWSQRFGAAQEQTGQGVVVDASGNIIMIATFSGTVDFGGAPLVSVGGADLGLARFNPTGAYLFGVGFGSTSSEVGWSVATDPSGNVLVMGSFNGTADFGGGPLVSAGSVDIMLAKYADRKSVV